MHSKAIFNEIILQKRKMDNNIFNEKDIWDDEGLRK